VTLTGDALTGALAYAQALCESGYGAGRRLEQQQYLRVREVLHRQIFLEQQPVASVALVRIRVFVDSWGRASALDWYSLSVGDWVLDARLARITLQSLYPTGEAEVTYTAGIDFAASPLSRDAIDVKACAGRIVTHVSNNRPGLETYQLDAGGLAAVETVRYAPLDDTLQQLLMPLKRFAPYSGT